MGEQNNENQLEKKDWKRRNTYDHFDGFLKTFVVDKNSYIMKEVNDKLVPLSSLNDGSYDLDTINTTYANFCNASKKDDKGKEKTIGEIDLKKFTDIDIEILNHAIFLWGLPNKGRPALVLKDTKNKTKYNEMPTCEVGRAGQEYNGKLERVRFILYIFTQVFEKLDVNEIKKEIEKICKKVNYLSNDNNITYDVPSDLRNFLLHLCSPKDYSPIATDADKERIVNAFAEGIEGIEESDDIDKKIKKIREEITKDDPKNSKIKIIQRITGNSNDYPFYEDKIKWLWRGESDGENLSRVQLLEYKKAMVLYGPPGTGKTYTAMELAKEMLVRYWVKQYENLKKEEKEVAKGKLEDCINNIKKITEIKDLIEGNKIEEKNIYYLQLHVNYSYENFIAGQVIEDNKIVTKKGFIYDVIEKANNKKQEPFVVILDEMNRVDVSRVFGELFTAIEKRGTDVDLTLPKPPKDDDSSKESNNTEENDRLTLTIPENIYFIGTMNEIDFSLEQLDFALRRRFIWELADYNSDSLEEIINSRLKDLDDKFKSVISSFIGCCENVNKTIEGHNSLGKEYHIGHAFFAEVAEIIKKLVLSSKNQNKDTIWKNAKSILWQISILPTLEAYCGTMDSSDKKTFIEKCKASYEGKSE